MEIYKNSCPKCHGNLVGLRQPGWFRCENCREKYPRFMIGDPEKREECPYCNGTTLDLSGDSGGTCPHCFGGYLMGI